MIVVISQTFLRQYLKFWGKGAPHIAEFCLILKQQIQSQTLYLNRPYAKLKFSYQAKAVRMIVKINDNAIIPFFISDKNDKLYGENMIRDTVKVMIELLENKIADNILEGFVFTYKV